MNLIQLSSLRRRCAALVAAGFVLLGATVAQAVPIVGAKIIVQTDGEVVATYRGNSASYSNDLYLYSPNSYSSLIFNNHASSIGSTVNLGFFSAGTELIFKLYVNNTGNTFYTGDGSLNGDGYAHARVDEAYAVGESLVEFEDLYNGPFEFNDLSFSFTNVGTTQVPPSNGVPDAATTLPLIGLALAGLVAVRKSRR